LVQCIQCCGMLKFCPLSGAPDMLLPALSICSVSLTGAQLARTQVT